MNGARKKGLKMVKGLEELKELKIEMEKEGIDSNLKNVDLIIEIMGTLKRYDALEDKSFENLVKKSIQCFKLF